MSFAGFPQTIYSTRQELSVFKWILKDFVSRAALLLASTGSDQIFEIGTVFGQQTLGAVTSAAGGGNTGTGTVGSLTKSSATKLGAYALSCIAVAANGLGATFQVLDPNGRRLADAYAAVAYAQPDLDFTIAEGGGLPTTGTAAAVGTNVGNGTFGTIAVASPAEIGVYNLRMQDATHFVVETPQGIELGHGVCGSAFSAGGIGFTLTAGGTAFVAGDSFNITVAATGGTPFVVGDSFAITVAAGNGKYYPVNATAVDGTQNAAAINYARAFVPASVDADVGGIIRQAAVLSDTLIWPNGATNNQIAAWLAQLQNLGIIGLSTI